MKPRPSTSLSGRPRLPVVFAAGALTTAVVTATTLSIQLSPPGNVKLSWPVNPPGLQLQERPDLSTNSAWQFSPLVPQRVGDVLEAFAPATNATTFFRLLQTDTTDVPDSGYADSNFDGIDGDIEKAVFVAPPPRGNDANPGTMNAPLATLEAGISMASRVSPSKDVYVSTGTYRSSQPLELASGISLYGQYDAANGWRRAATNETILQGATTAIEAARLDRETHVEGFTIQAASAVVPGESSYGVRAFNVTGELVLRYNRIEAGSGAPGRPGVSGLAGQPGGEGGKGLSGEDGGWPGDGGSSPCGYSGGRGGPGGYNSPGYSGRGGVGWNGVMTTPGAPGVGGTWSSPCDEAQDGFHGVDGAPGDHGRNGLAVTDYGSIENGYFQPGRGTVGTGGSAGMGGGGAGGGGANVYAFLGCYPFVGGGGGGGGGGGCPGTPGTVATGGGSAFGVFLVNSRARITQNHLMIGNGGKGGNGGNGGLGGAGGAAGANGEGWELAAPGGNGGRGGNGGTAGSGSGAPGGHVVGILQWQSTQTVVESNTMVLGLPGDGGLGGRNDVLGPAPSGPKGFLRDIAVLPANP